MANQFGLHAFLSLSLPLPLSLSFPFPLRSTLLLDNP